MIFSALTSGVFSFTALAFSLFTLVSFVSSFGWSFCFSFLGFSSVLFFWGGRSFFSDLVSTAFVSKISSVFVLDSKVVSFFWFLLGFGEVLLDSIFLSFSDTFFSAFTGLFSLDAAGRGFLGGLFLFWVGSSLLDLLSLMLSCFLLSVTSLALFCWRDWGFLFCGLLFLLSGRLLFLWFLCFDWFLDALSSF